VTESVVLIVVPIEVAGLPKLVQLLELKSVVYCN
jgi:hypothetical protein